MLMNNDEYFFCGRTLFESTKREEAVSFYRQVLRAVYFRFGKKRQQRLPNTPFIDILTYYVFFAEIQKQVNDLRRKQRGIYPEVIQLFTSDVNVERNRLSL